MAGDAMLAMPMSHTQSTKEFGNAAVQWACTRRGRMMVLTITLLTILLGLTGMRHHEVRLVHSDIRERARAEQMRDVPRCN